jgi:hypothetical protein
LKVDVLGINVVGDVFLKQRRQVLFKGFYHLFHLRLILAFAQIL